MNYENYRRAMDGAKLSDAKKAELCRMAEATPIRGSSRFSKIKKRKFAQFASLAACFTVICIAGIPAIIGATLRCGSADPEATTESIGLGNQWYNSFYGKDLELEADAAVTAATAATMAEAQATATPTEAVAPIGYYRDIYMLMYPDTAVTETVTTTETVDSDPTGDQSTSPYTSRPSPKLETDTFSAKTNSSRDTVTVKNAAGQSSIIYGSGTEVVALCSYGDCLIVVAEIGTEAVAFAYDITDISSAKLLGSLGISGMLVDAVCEGDLLTITTEFTPAEGSIEALESYIPRIFYNGGSHFVSPGNCTMTYTGNGGYTCFVVTKLDISGTPELVSVKADFQQKD